MNKLTIYSVIETIASLLQTQGQRRFVLFSSILLWASQVLAQDVYNFSYTGAQQSITLQPGRYKLEVWGAQGGVGYAGSVGGKGAYAQGVLTLTDPTTIYIYVGQQPSNKTGGWNGGGGGNINRTDNGGGGGASDFRLAGGSWNNSTGLYSRILVAAGGAGGNHGGTQNPVGGDEQSYGFASYIATDRSAGSGGGFGYGATVDAAGANPNGGAGGGWFGGGGITGGESLYRQSSGGSSYAYTSSSYKPSGYNVDPKYQLSASYLIAGDALMPTPNGSTGTGRGGHGYARITSLPQDVLNIYNFPYAGAEQSITLQPGRYKLEVWGAQGGTGEGYQTGSRGGYASGEINLSSTTTFYIYVGGKGQYFSYGGVTHSTRVSRYGGWNGGGGNYYSAASFGTGGGGTDIALVSSSLTANNYRYLRTDASYKSRIIVAGGGGGNGAYQTGIYAGGGSNGVGSSGIFGTQESEGYSPFDIYANAGFGYGGTGKGGSGGGNGGGGGWYGGAGMKGGTSRGGGGSGYVYTSTSHKPSGYNPGSQYYLTNTSLIAGNASMPNPSGGTMTGRSGNGYTRITQLSSGGTVSSTTSVFCTSSTDPAAFTSEAAAIGGSGTFSYQWQVSTDGTTFSNISGATALTYDPSEISQTTYYRRKATNSLTLYSNILTLEKFEITSQPSTTNQTLTPGSGPTPITVGTSTDTGALFQWYSNSSASNSGGILVSGATSSTLTPDTSNTGKLYYYAVVTKGGCSITSEISGLVNVENPISQIPIADGTWQPMIKQENFDPNDDQQAVKDTDLVGDATNAMLETQRATYNFSTGASSDEVYYFRVRMGASHSRGKLGTSFYLALDKDNDYVADVFVEANVKDNTPYVAFHLSDPSKAGTGPSNTGWLNSSNNDNVERELTSRDAFIKAYDADTDLDSDETDTWIEFAFTEESLKSFVSDALGVSIDGDSMFAIYTFTSTSQTANGDIGGIDDRTADLTKTWEELGIVIKGSLNDISTNAILKPTVTAATYSDLTPTITGTWGSDKEGTDALTVALNGITYTTSDALTVDGYSWSLTIPDANTLTPGSSYTVSATTTRGAESKTGTGTIYIQDNDATLSGLTLSDLTLSPSFSSGTYSYSASASSTLNSTDLVATLNSVSSTLSIDGVIQSSSVSITNALSFGTNSITITVLAENGVNSNTYQIDILKLIDPTIVVNDNTTREPVAEVAGSVVAAPAQSGNFNVSLPEAPSSDVVITFVVSDNTEATISPSSLTFTSDNYSTAQTVTLTGIDDTENDSLRDGPQSFTVTGTVTSSDPAYNNVTISPIVFTNLDGDPPGITVELTGNTANESGTSITATFSMLSTLTPAGAQVDLPLTLNDGSEASFSNSSVVTSATVSFTNTQTTTSIIIYGVDDSLSDGTQSVTLVTGDPSSSGGNADTGYDALDASDVADLSFSVTDNEFVSDIYTDFGGYWTSGISSISSTKPNNNHDLLGFTFGGTTYSTGVNDGVLTANSVTFTAGEFRALPINLLPNTYKKSYYVTLGNTLDGSAETVQSPTNNFPAYPSQTKLAEYLTDGVNGLNLGTGFANIPSGSRLEFNVNAIDNTNIGDGEPDFLVTQIAVPGNSKLDEFWFEDVNGNMVGNKVIIDLSLQDVLGVWRTDRFTLDGESESKLIDKDRDIRFKAFEISEFGVTSSNSSNIKKLVYILSGTSDPAFIAYNVPTVSLPTKLSKSAGSTTYKYNTVLTTPISIQVKDASNNNVTQAGITITAGVQSGTATLSGTLEVVTDANGVATFTDLTVNGTGDQELKFTAPGLDTATTTLSFARITTTMTGFPGFTVNTLQEPFALTPPTTNSTAPIIYSSTNTAVATVDSSTGSVTVVGAGTTSITAFVIQNDYYTAGTITATMTVIKSDATIIDFTDITKTFGDADFPLTGTSSSTGAITYTVSDTTVATVSGNTVTIVGAGTTSITLTQASDDTYNSATATITLMVNKATPSYTVTDVTKTYDDPAFNIDSSMLVSSSTGTLTFTVSDTTVATLTGTNTLNIQGAGSTVITAVQSATDNYTTGTTSFTLSVDKNNAVILSDSSSPISDVTLAFSDPSFAKTATSSSTGSFTFTSSNTDVITLSTTATTTTSKTVSHTIAGAGTSIITVSQAADANYNAATVSYTVTVTKADPNLSAISDITKTYGDANDTVINTLSTTTAIQYTSSNPSVVQIASTEVGSDTQTATLVFTGAGTAIVTATLSETANYESATISFTVTVTKATPTLSGFADITKTYGDADFSLVQPTSTSGGGFTYASSNTATATITGDTVSMSHSGNVVITATQAANANYESGTISLTLTINKASQSISVDPLPSTKPLKDFITIPLTATSSSGNPVNVSLASGSVATLSGTVGNYELTSIGTTGIITVTFSVAATSQYNAASVSLSMDVVKTAQSISYAPALPTEVTYSDGLTVPLTASASSGLGISYNVISGPAILTGSSLTISQTGVVVVEASQVGNTAYNPAPTDTKTIIVKPGTVTLSNFSVPMKVDSDPDFTITAPSSTVPGTIVYSSSNLSVANMNGNTVEIIAAGTTSITATQLAIPNKYNSANITTNFVVAVGDTDGDGVLDPVDLCPNTIAGASVDANGCAPYQKDTDADGVMDDVDNCVTTANADQADTDGDGVGDVCDNAPNTPNADQADTDGDGTPDAEDNDDDNDGVPDTEDDFPTDPNETTDNDGDGIGDNADTDLDNDGVLNSDDNCPTTPNANQLDTDGDGTGDVCDSDDDGDGYSDADEIACGSDRLLASSIPLDTDQDGIPNCLDDDDDNDGYSDMDEITCGTDPLIETSSPLDTDADGIPDCIDTDDDGDGVLDTEDAFPLDKDEWTDTDGDGIGNNEDEDDDNDGQSDADEIACGSDPLDNTSLSPDFDQDNIPDCVDTDDDNDGVVDTEDAFPLDQTEWTDTDSDGIGNNADGDDDNDGYSDLDELECNSDPLDLEDLPGDLDQDGIPDCKDNDIDGDGCINTEDVFPRDASECEDTDGDGLGDNMDIDSDNDGVPNSLDAFPLDASESKDTDGDGIGDNTDTDNNNDGFNDSDLLVSGALTPNSSGLESTWKIINLDKYPNARVSVYNKNGQEVFSAQGYRNDWRGTYKNSADPLPASSYYYVVELNTGEKPITGWLYITY